MSYLGGATEGYEAGMLGVDGQYFRPDASRRMDTVESTGYAADR
jgi:hypothetical protein